MVESLAATVEQNGASTEQLAKSVQSVAKSGQRISDEASGAATSATDSITPASRSPGWPGRPTRCTRRAARRPKEGGVGVQRSMQGLGRVKRSMGQSAAVIRDMGKRTGEIGGIVNTIDLIAERTNLLSLNASIEAARQAMRGGGSLSLPRRFATWPTVGAATADIAAIIKALQEVAREAVAASNEGVRVVDQSNLQAEEGARGLAKILDGVTEASRVVEPDCPRQ